MYGLQERSSVRCPQTAWIRIQGYFRTPSRCIYHIQSYKEDDELFYANEEFLHMSGYKDIDELFRLTKKSFRNLIREDEQQQIESSIWEQIDSGNENDYIHFHLRKADGTYFSVLDHGRIVGSQQYGKVFYVLFMDWEDMHIRYSDKFSR